MVFNDTYIGNTYEIFAFIRVTYPAGATCICSNGTVTLYAGDTSGSYAFGVPSPAGTWTVSCPGTSISSQNVVVSTEGMSYTASLS